MNENKIIIDCIADLHGYYPELEGGDLLIIAGDFTDGDTLLQHSDMLEWINKQSYRKKVIIGGNHDNVLEKNPNFYSKTHIDYLCDSGTEFEYERWIEGHQTTQTLKIWGSPWTKSFEGMNPHCKAFTLDTEEELAEKWALIPDDVDILVTHSPAAGLRDFLAPRADEKKSGIRKSVGSASLLLRIGHIDQKGDGKKRLLVCGHIHGARGTAKHYSWKHDRNNWKIVNASYVNDVFEPYKEPIRIIWENPSK